MNVLNLTLKRKWFEMIACGEKKEEYRKIKPYWIQRFCKKHPLSVITGGDLIEKHTGRNYSFKDFDRVFSKNGYSKTSPIIHWEHLGITIGEPNPSWCEPQDAGKKVFILKIGDILYKG